ncbi:MAG: hypothetical protein KDA29_06540 [Phycisphaerales bacterium]|nr:hypothetical protein [Phycisphaerales bacterium]
MIIRKNILNIAVISLIITVPAMLVVLRPEPRTCVLRPLRSQTRVRILVSSLQIYAEANDFRYPPSEAWIQHLCESGIIAPEDALAPIRDDVSEPYHFVPGPYTTEPGRILVYGNPDRNIKGVMVGFTDYTVDLVGESDFEQMLAEQLADTTP